MNTDPDWVVKEEKINKTRSRRAKIDSVWRVWSWEVEVTESSWMLTSPYTMKHDSQRMSVCDQSRYDTLQLCTDVQNLLQSWHQ